LRADLPGHRLVAVIGGGHRLLDHRERTGPERVHRDLERRILDRVRDHHDRRRPARHDPARRLQPVDAGQADIHGDHIGPHGLDRGQRRLAGLHRAGEFQARVAGDDVREEDPHHERILDNQHAHARILSLSAHSN
jgi:hypothetical protein